MSSQQAIVCANCGTTMEPPQPGTTSVRCRVCQLVNEIGAAPQTLAFTRDSLEHSLGNLLAQARAGGLTSDEIVATLRDELEFAAELAHVGRQICVQIIDLGPSEGQTVQQPVRDRTTVLRGRAVGG
ncbi:MAG TPA: hypothetical protein PKD53_09475 [Chloroflexaceae bacterium]|nr:hypothetical protein [Chloroflexaceae bacterium]